MKLSVSNTGSETLDVIGIFCDNMFCISADPSSFSLEPGEETEVNITYTNDMMISTFTGIYILTATIR